MPLQKGQPENREQKHQETRARIRGQRSHWKQPSHFEEEGDQAGGCNLARQSGPQPAAAGNAQMTNARRQRNVSRSGDCASSSCVQSA